jgi:hypothetical protein
VNTNSMSIKYSDSCAFFTMCFEGVHNYEDVGRDTFGEKVFW